VEAPRRSPRPGWRRALLLAALLVACGLALRGLGLALTYRVPMGFVHGASFQAAALALAVVAGLALLALWLEWRSPSLDDADLGPALLRWALVVCVMTWVLFLLFAQPFQRLHFDLALGLGAGAWAGSLLALRRLRAVAPGTMRGVELVAFSLCTALLGLELGLRAYAGLSPSPLTARVGVGPRELVQRFRCEPGEVRFGFPCNSRGFYDTEFFRDAEAEGELIVSIGDSFSVGAVPHAWHYSTILEELTGRRVYSMGVAGIGPPEYAYLLAEEAMPLNPDQILVAVFVGNDLMVDEALHELPDSGLRSWFQRDQVLAWVIPDRMARLRAEVARGADIHAMQGERMEAEAGVATREEAAAAFPWVLDPSLEDGTLSEEVFLELEAERALTMCGQDPPAMDIAYRSLLAARDAAGGVPLRVLLIPDEFQVEDGLWAQVQELAKEPLERDRPQRLLRAWLEREGFEYLDLLPALRAAEPLEDGRRHLYHHLDTHFNARGNELTARALADFLTFDR